MATITDIEFIWIRIPLAHDFRGSVYHVPEKNAIITRIRTSDGLVGECMNGEGGADVHAHILHFLQTEFAPLLIGEDPSEIERLWAKLWRRTDLHSWRRREAVRAVACLDSALWDLKGKTAGLPLHVLWGGARSSLPILAIGGQYRDGSAELDYGHEMEEYLALGLAGCKFKVAGRTPEIDSKRTRAARKAAGDDFIICADANRGWSKRDALAYAQLVHDVNLRWLEEPCFWENDREDMAAMRATSGLPICSGQSEITAQGCRDLMVSGAIDICNIDASWGGGPTAWLRIAKMAAAFGVEMAHHGEPLVGAHLLAAVDNGTYLETHHPDRDPVFHQMVVGRGTIANGYYTLPDAPGWGVTFDPAMVAKYRAN